MIITNRIWMPNLVDEIRMSRRHTRLKIGYGPAFSFSEKFTIDLSRLEARDVSGLVGEQGDAK